jgi:sialate O-acetylesterase
MFLRLWIVVPILSTFALSASARADLKPFALFSDHAVLQQGVPTPVWGECDEGDAVTVELAGQSVQSQSEGGRWRVTLAPLPAGGPFVMTIRGRSQTLVINDVMVGEVWLCSGQSNMARTLVPPDSVQPRRPYWEQAAAAADFPAIRHFAVGNKPADEPMRQVQGQWQVCTPASARAFSAVAYFFARDLHQSRGVPVGLITAAVGATGAAEWISRPGLESHPTLAKILERQARAKEQYPQQLAQYQADEPRLLAEHAAAAESARAQGKPEPRKPTPPRDPFNDYYRPTAMYNSRIAPLPPYALAGVLWYQGESNSGHAAEYAVLLTTLMRTWREAWGRDDLPFLVVQLPEYQKTPPEFRETQRQVCRQTPHTAMVVTLGAGDARDVHPPDKEPVGQRLALAARATVYGESIEWSGPMVESITVDAGRAVLRFTHVGGGLMAMNQGQPADMPGGFTVAGADRRFVPAQAKIEGDRVVVWSEAVPDPRHVRYAWEHVPQPTLFNRAGLPASPFQSESR